MRICIQIEFRRNIFLGMFSMGYAIDISFDISKITNVSETKELLIAAACQHTCSRHYEDYDMQDDLRHRRSHCIMTFIFDDDNLTGCTSFAREIKSWSGVYVECLYQEGVAKCTLDYASPSYIQNMHKAQAKDYVARRKQRGYTAPDLGTMPQETQGKRRRRKPRGYTAPDLGDRHELSHDERIRKHSWTSEN